MVKKRTSLASLLETTPEPDAETLSFTVAPSPTQASTGRRAHVKQQTVYLPLPVYEQLRRLAFEERSKMHSLLMEGLDRVFKDRGLSSIDDLTPSNDG